MSVKQHVGEIVSIVNMHHAINDEKLRDLVCGRHNSGPMFDEAVEIANMFGLICTRHEDSDGCDWHYSRPAGEIAATHMHVSSPTG